MNILKQFENIEKEAERIYLKLEQVILNLPDNSKIERLDNICYTMNLSDLNKFNLSAEYYDFKFTYKKLVEWINNKDVKNVRVSLIEAIEKKKFRASGVWYFLHPEVIENLKSIL